MEKFDVTNGAGQLARRAVHTDRNLIDTDREPPLERYAANAAKAVVF